MWRLNPSQIPNHPNIFSQILVFRFPITRYNRLVMSNRFPLYPRRLRARVDEAMADTPVVLIAGPRQAGKTTLVKQIADRRMHYLTLDEELTLLAAKEDPVGLIRERDYLIVDEVQRAPELILAYHREAANDVGSAIYRCNHSARCASRGRRRQA